MANDWAPEPWKYVTDYKIHVPFGLRAADGVAIFMLDDKLGPIIADADGERIAACVSACAGVPTEWLNSDMWQHIMSTFKCACTDNDKEATHDDKR